jgi:hypothetical protein
MATHPAAAAIVVAPRPLCADIIPFPDQHFEIAPRLKQILPVGDRIVVGRKITCQPEKVKGSLRLLDDTHGPGRTYLSIAVRLGTPIQLDPVAIGTLVRPCSSDHDAIPQPHSRLRPVFVFFDLAR